MNDTFKVGDTVELSENYSGHYKGDRFVIEEVEYRGIDLLLRGFVELPNDRKRIAVFSKRVKSVTNQGGVKVDNTETKWMFHVNAEYQIDFPRIAEDLTLENPIALVRTPYKMYCVVRKQLAAKLQFSECERELKDRLMACTQCEGVIPEGVVFVLEQEMLGAFFSVWKDVKKGRHAKEYRGGKREVTVSLQSL